MDIKPSHSPGNKFVQLLCIISLVLIPLCGLQAAISVTPIIGTSELVPGMKGYGLTVFVSNRIERFDVEVMGVLKNARIKGDLIIARLSGGILEKTGVIAGMSGSPVFFNGKLAGAVAFSWSFSKDPIAGITPIGDMLTVLDAKNTTNSQPLPFFPGTGKEKSIGPFEEGSSGHGYELRKVSVPLVFSGLDDRLFKFLSEKFQGSSFLPVQGGSSSGDSEAMLPASNMLQPGSAVAIRMITGDLNLSGVGTVTWNENGKLLIFGHPMFSRGSCNYPVALANVLTVFAGYEISFKIATAGPIVGHTVQDRAYAVSCELGNVPEMIPVHVVQNYQGNDFSYNYKFLPDMQYFQHFLAICIANSMLHDKSPMEKSTFSMRVRIKLSDGNIIEISDVYSDLTTISILYDSLSDVMRPVQELILNPFKKVEPVDVDVRIWQSDVISAAEISDILLESPWEIHPGDILKLQTKFRLYQGKTWSTNLEVHLPENLPEGPLMLFITGARDERMITEMLAPEQFIPKSYQQMLDRISEQDRNNECVVWGLTREPGLVINGEKFPNLPDTRYAILQNSREDSTSPMAMKFKRKTTLPFAVYGFKKIIVQVKKYHYGRDQ
jgi:hypothetical protein